MTWIWRLFARRRAPQTVDVEFCHYYRRLGRSDEMAQVQSRWYHRPGFGCQRKDVA